MTFFFLCYVFCFCESLFYKGRSNLACAVYSYERNADYEKSDIKKFLEKCFIKEIQPSKINENINEDISEEKINDLMDLISMLYPEEKQKEKILKK